MDNINTTFNPLKNNDIVSILYKKYLGYANSLSTTQPNAEFGISALPLVFANKVAIKNIPRINVPNIEVLIDNNSYSTLFNEPDNILNDSNAIVGKKYVWKAYNYISYYYRLLLSPNIGNSYYSRRATPESTESNPIFEYYLSNAIPFNFTIDGSVYDIKVEYKINPNDNTSWISLPSAQYVLDRDAGLLTIFEEGTTKLITSGNPPRISFWRYEGATLESFDMNASLNYGNDTFLGDTLFEQPPAPIEKTPKITPSTSEILLRWTNPEQFNVGFMCEKLPFINEFYITITDSSTPANTYNIINGETSIDYIPPSIIGVAVKNGSGINGIVTRTISGNSEKIYEWYRNSDNINRVLVEPLIVNIWYKNCSSKSDVKKLTIGQLKYSDQGESPSTPTATYTVDSTSINYNITKGLYTNILNTIDTTTELVGYIVKYKGVTREPTDTKPKRRTVDYLFPETTRFIEYTGADPVTGTITDLYPGTSYEVELKAVNSLGKVSATITNRLELDLPNIGNTIADINLKSVFKTAGSTAHYILDGYYNGQLRGLILKQGINAPNTLDKAATPNPIRLMTKNTGGTKLADNVKATTIECSINNSVDVQVRFEYKGFPVGQIGERFYKNNNESESNIIGNVIGSTIGLGQSIQKTDNFYTGGIFNLCIKGTALTAGTTENTLFIKQTYEGDTQVDSNELKYSVDNLSGTPIISNFNYTLSSSDRIFVCGVPMSDGKWSIDINNIVTQNIVSYFHANNFITYNFTGKEGVVLNSYAGTGNSNIMFLSSTPSTIINTDAIDTFYYLPNLVVKAKTIDNIEASYTRVVGILIDEHSVNLSNILKADIIPNNVPDNNSAGVRVETSTPAINTLENMLKDYTTSKNIFNNTKLLTTDYKNDLQIFDGRFITKGYQLENAQYGYGSYTNLDSGPNYSTILPTGYRYATFRWSVLSGKMNRLIFRIRGIKGQDLPLGYGSAFNLVTNSNKSIRLYYRIVDTTLVNGEYQEKLPQNMANPMIYENFSTVWIDANSINNQEHFGTLYGIRPDNPAWKSHLGGLPDKNSLIINNNIANSTAEVEYNVRCNTIDLERTVYIYAMIGLPMDSSISFNSLSCYAFYI